MMSRGKYSEKYKLPNPRMIERKKLTNGCDGLKISTLSNFTIAAIF